MPIVPESTSEVSTISTSVISVFPMETPVWAYARILEVISCVILTSQTYPATWSILWYLTS